MAWAEQQGVGYLFKMRLTLGGKNTIERLMRRAQWCDAGHGWQGADTSCASRGWSRSRRVIVLCRLQGDLAAVAAGGPSATAPDFAELTEEIPPTSMRYCSPL